MTEFERFIESLGLRYFRAGELLLGLDRGNDPPPPELWHNIALPLVMLDRLRGEFGLPVRITSAYRIPYYNRLVGGTLRSQHQAFAALDFEVIGLANQSQAASLLRSWRGELFRVPITVVRVAHQVPAGKIPYKPLETWRLVGGPDTLIRFAGGVGTYGSFTHLDFRGTNATWRGA